MLYRFSRLFGMNPDIISFAGGSPDPRLCPAVELAEAARKTMTTVPRSLQYNRDLPELKAQVIRMMKRRGISCSPDEVAITAGGQHAMDILTRLFLNANGEVMLEELVYTGIQQTVMPFKPEVLSIPIDPETGLDLDAVESHLASGKKPAFLYTIPEAHNPAGITLSQGKRTRLVEIARRYRLPIIEDDAYGFLNYDDPSTKALRALDSDNVLYIGSFSKILAPGLRLGWIVAPKALTPNILVLKQMSMLTVAPLVQHIVSTYLADNDFMSHIETVRDAYAERRDAMLQAMATHFPAQARWTKPQGGMFIWVKLPFGIDAEEAVYRAVEEAGVGYIPGKAFATDPASDKYDSYFRLSFTKYRPDQIVAGIERLGRTLRDIAQGS
jgi:2-aminoadipate transaminase